MASPSSETIAVFGATGGTGSKVVRFALEQGYKVQVLVRTPSKLEDLAEHKNLSITEGDFSNAPSIQAVVKGAQYVIVCAGGNVKQTPYNAIMGPFIQDILWPAMKASPSLKVFLYQAGAAATTPGGPPLPFSIRMMLKVIDCFINLSAMVADNQDVIDFIGASSADVKFDWIVTRPGGIKKGPATKTKYYGELDKPNMGMITFADLAKFSLEALHEPSLYGKFPYPSPQ